MLERIRTMCALGLLPIVGCGAPDPASSGSTQQALGSGSCELTGTEADVIAEIAAMRAEIDALETSGAINAGRARALRNHLDNALRDIAAGRYCPAVAQIEALATQLANFVDAGVLTEAAAAPIVDAAGSLLGTVPATAIVNPSFEADGTFSYYTQAPTGWSVEGVSDFATDQFGGGVGTVASFDNFFVTDGTYGARVFTRTGADTTGAPVPRTFYPGEFVRVYQDIDLSGVDSVHFDVELRPNSFGTWPAFLEARVLIDGVPLWTGTTQGTFIDQIIDTSALGGEHTFEFRLEVVSEETVGFVSAWYLFDNVRLSP